MAPFEAFYASSVQHPILLWVAAGLGLAVCATRSGLAPSVWRYCVLLTALSASDAWLTSTHVFGFGKLTGGLASAVPLFFILAGDFRFLLLLGVADSRGTLRPSARRILAAAGLTCIVPLFSQAVVAMLPETLAGSRVLFLVYEVAFMLLTAGLMRWHPGARSVPWLAPVCRFVVLYYGLWALADAILLLTGSDFGFLLRVVPNLLYYGGLIGVIGWAASRRAPA